MKTLFFCLLAAVALTANAAVVMGPIVNPANGHTYYLLSQNTWTRSEAEAVALGGHLATIRNAAEQEWIYKTFSGQGASMWIGLTDREQEGTFKWISGEPVEYTNWEQNEPDNGTGGVEHYTHIWPPGERNPSKWNDYLDDDGVWGYRLQGIVEVADAAAVAGANEIKVPATSTPYLAGMPDGSKASGGSGYPPDVAPDHSPVKVPGLSPGVALIFSATGSINHGGGLPFASPDGETFIVDHYAGAENGISNIKAPFNALLGVFLRDGAPEPADTPDALDFFTAASRDYRVLAPALQQVFFIGDGKTSDGAEQQVIVPPGATRLYLGTMDSYGWANNQGAFLVTMRTGVPDMEHLSKNPSIAEQSEKTSPTVTRLNLPAPPVFNSPGVPGTESSLIAPTLVAGPELKSYTAIELAWQSQAGALYQVQWTPSLQSLSWTNLGVAVSGNGGEVSVFDSTRHQPAGFYRVQVVQ